MPRKRKTTEASDEPADETLAVSESEVKAEALSEEGKETPPTSANEVASVTPSGGNNPCTRSLRPRKVKCYTEKDSPEFEEKPAVCAQRRKRRLVSTDDNECNSESSKRRTTGKDTGTTPIKKEITTPEKINLEKILDDLPIPTLGPVGNDELCDVLNCEGKVDEPLIAKEAKIPKPKRKRPRKPPPVTEVKKEPDDVPMFNDSEADQVQDQAEAKSCKSAANGADRGGSTEAAPKPKPKRIRNKKKPLALPPAGVTTGSDEPGIKKEPIDGEASVPDTDTKQDEVAAKVPVKKKRNKPKISQCNKAKVKISNSTVPGEAKPLEGKDLEEVKAGEEKVKKKGNGNAARRPRPRPPRPTKSVENAESKGTLNTEGVDDTKPEENQVKPLEAKEGEKSNDIDCSSRKFFGRGRRSKLLSSRTNKNEVIHQEEAIDPEDIRGFEHIERYTTPPGVRLPKFWDSEDELSDDDSNDNFRRIMCGFGTNCRVHEVIRPVSEIVRRLKELQTTFGATRTLPLFQRDRDVPSDSKANWTGDGGESSRPKTTKKIPILWHNDPMFFKYANNFP